MRYVNFGKSALKVSEFCLGTMSFGAGTDAAEADRIVKCALDMGVNFFDTANAYHDGASEEYLGRAIAGLRDQVIIATKAGSLLDAGEGINDQGSSRYHIVGAVETSLRRLNTDRIDIYLVHMPHPGMNLEETLRALDDLMRQGKILYAGCSNFPAWLLCKSLWVSDVRKLTSFICLQSVYNLIERGVEVEILPLCHAEGLAVMSYRPMCAGVLSGRYSPGNIPEDYPNGAWVERFAGGIERLRQFAQNRGKTAAQAALAWVRSHPVVTCPIVGVERADELAGAIEAFDWHLTAAEREELAGYFGAEMTEHQIGVHAAWRTSYELIPRCFGT
ncbi:MAG: aldo/keto reductase [Armatimonadota bacterium]|nr:aldo/keto reductase [Armatimonadota bacterium]